MISFNRGHLHGSINIPYNNQTFLETGELSPSENANVLVDSKGKIIVVVGGKANNKWPKVNIVKHLFYIIVVSNNKRFRLRRVIISHAETTSCGL